MIQLTLAEHVRRALEAAQASGALPPFEVPRFEMERPAKAEHGDWATGVALALARSVGKPPRMIAQALVDHLGEMEHVSKVEIAGPGFVNFSLTHAWLTDVVRDVIAADEDWGRSKADAPEKIQVEFVSANPTGPLHLGHGRWAAVGDVLATLLEMTGHTVEREFYINDHGRQMLKFGRSIAVRYLEHLGRDAPPIPEGGYQGQWVRDIAAEVAAEAGDRYAEVSEAERDEWFRFEGERRALEHQRETLERFGVTFDTWFSERGLHDSGAVQHVLDYYAAKDLTYEADGALWLRTADFGDHKDRVLIRSDADRTPTYLAPDIAYFEDKMRRGFDRAIYLLGADHHDHVSEMLASISALGGDAEKAEFLLGQFVHLSRGGTSVKMSKRTGEAVTFDELLAEVGTDAGRYLFLRQSLDRTVNFDIDLAISQSQENPVFYVQYAHARICSIMRKAASEGIETLAVERVALDELQHDSEVALLRKIAEFPDAIVVAAKLRAPHRMATFAEELAALFHGFYRDCRVVSDDPALTQARLHLCRAAQITLRNALRVLGVSAPEQM